MTHKTVTEFVGMRAALVAFVLVGVGGCSHLCSNKVVYRAEAPDRQHTAVLFQRDCGATTGFSTQISVLRPGEQLTGSGNAYRADDDHGKAADGEWRGPWAEMRWLTPDRLLVRYAAKSRIFEQDDSVSAVSVIYQAVPR